MLPHSIAKSAVKPIFSPLPHPPFSLQNLRFSRFSPFRTRFRAIFRGIALVFCPVKPTFSRSFPFWVRLPTIFRGHVLVFSRSTVYFLSHSPILNPISGDFLMARHSFQPRTSIFPCFSLYFPTLRALLRKISPFIFPANTFPIRLFPFCILCFTFLFPLISFPLFIHPSLFAPSPLSFSFLPTFPSSSPNKRTNARTLVQYARTRTPAPIRTSGGFRLFPSPHHPPHANHGAPTR